MDFAQSALCRGVAAQCQAIGGQPGHLTSVVLHTGG
jgi:hypothetical protein